jgi:hypothetical protein
VGLTSPALSYVLGAVAIVLLVAILAGWRWMSKPGVRSIALRVVSIVLLQASVLAFIFVAVNRSAEFYSSWSDLFGSDTTAGAVVAPAKVTSAKVASVAETARIVLHIPGQSAPAGSLQSVSLSGKLSGLTVAGHVFVPAGYPASGGTAGYPVIVVLSNQLNSPKSPYGAVRLAEDMARQIAARQLPPLVMVMLPASLSKSGDGCLNVPAEPAAGGAPVQAATFFSQDLPGLMASGYRARTPPGGWALLADGSGGYCALQLAVANSWVYSVAVAPVGNFTNPPGWAATAGSAQLADQDNLLWLMRNQPMQRVDVLLTSPATGQATGTDEALLTLARPPMHVSTTLLNAGTWPLAGVLTWIGKALGQHAAAEPGG